MSGTNLVAYTVDLPSGGRLHLQTPDEVELWNQAHAKYRDDYVLVKHNDLVSLGALLLQQVILYRCQMAVSGMVPELDTRGIPTGNYVRAKLDGADLASYQRALTEASKEMRALEKSLGIDKATREAGGTHTLDNYVRTLKRAAHERAIHIATTVLEYQKVFNELSWKLRLLYKGDPQDRAYHNISPRTVLDWINVEVERLHQLDMDFAREKGKVYVGKL